MKSQNLSLKQLLETATSLAKKHQSTPVIIGLIGTLGAGKTTFVKNYLKTLGIKDAKSPSFVITHQYSSGPSRIFHIDLYRLNQATQLESLGLPEILNGENTVLIEWVDKFPQLLAKCDVIIKFKINPKGGRDVDISYRKT